MYTPHGVIETPTFMPVGTQATVKGVLPAHFHDTGAQIVLGNTYHLMLRPGVDRIKQAGGLAKFMGWRGATLTDSGGFQVMSLAQTRTIDASGVTFASPYDGSKLRLTPQSVIAAQVAFGSTIAMVLDECTKQPANYDTHKEAMARSMAWAQQAKHTIEQFAENNTVETSVFGIVQGGQFPDLRQASVESLLAIGFPGYAIGGLAVGEPRDDMLSTLAATAQQLPEGQPRYAMGLGSPIDIIEAVRHGVDMMDCVLPSRAGRTGRAYTWHGQINMRNARFADWHRPIDDTCPCYTCRQFTHAYLHHLFRCKEMLGPMLLTLHNLTFYGALMTTIRDAIETGQIEKIRKHLYAVYGDEPAS